MTTVWIEGILEPLPAGTPRVYEEAIVLVVDVSSTETGSTA